jgi:hypothetical protein
MLIENVGQISPVFKLCSRPQRAHDFPHSPRVVSGQQPPSVAVAECVKIVTLIGAH